MLKKLSLVCFSILFSFHALAETKPVSIRLGKETEVREGGGNNPRDFAKFEIHSRGFKERSYSCEWLAHPSWGNEQFDLASLATITVKPTGIRFNYFFLDYNDNVIDLTLKRHTPAGVVYFPKENRPLKITDDLIFKSILLDKNFFSSVTREALNATFTVTSENEKEIIHGNGRCHLVKEI